MQNKIVLQSDSDSPNGDSLHTQMLMPEQQALLSNIDYKLLESEALIVVTGAYGSGKSTLAKALTRYSSKNQDVVLIDADITLDTSNILSNLSHLDGFNPSLLLDGSDENEQLKSWFTTRQEQGKKLVVIIDKAEQLNSDVLTELVTLGSQVSCLSLVLFGLKGYADNIDTGENRALVHHLDMPLLSESSAFILLKQVYSPDFPLPLTDLELNTVYVESQGLPGPLLMKAADLLLTNDDKPNTIYKYWFNFQIVKEYFPITHLIALVGLLSILLLVVLYNPQANNTNDTEVEQLDTLSPIAGAVVNDAASKPIVTEHESTGADSRLVKSEQSVKSQIEKGSMVENSRVIEEAADKQKLMTAQEGFVIQLFGGYDQNNAKSFIDNEHKKLINARLYMYETTYNKKPWFVVVAGIYPSRNNAEQAVKSMPKELQKLSPWVRDIKTVQKTIM